MIRIFLFVCMAFVLPVQGQTIVGIVKDAYTHNLLPFCSVKLLQDGGGTVTGKDGHFMLALKHGRAEDTLVVSLSGYGSDTLLVHLPQLNYPVLLQPTQETLNEVVVTGVSKPTRIRENPVAIAAVSARAIERSSENNIIDVLTRYVPGLNVVKTGPNISKPFIRGLGHNRVLTLYDGIRQEDQQWGDEHGIEADGYNILRAEVIKGPASIMFGSDAVAGVVSLLPVMPPKQKEKLHGKYITEYQANNGLYGNGARLTWAANHWAVAVRGSYRIARNYTNRADGRVFNTGFRETNAAATIQHSGAAGYTTVNFTLYNNLQGIPDGSRDSLSRKFTFQVNEGSSDDVKNRPIVTDEVLNSYAVNPLHQHIQHYRAYSNHHYQLGGGSADMTIAFQQSIRGEYNHPTLPQQPGMQVRLNTVNYGLRYNAPQLLQTEISAGVNGMYQRNNSFNATDFPLPDYHLSDAGVYLYGKWKQQRLAISGGVRYDIRRVKTDDFYTGINPATGFTMRTFLPENPTAYLQFPALSKAFNGLSASFGATYQASNALTLKANIARGYRAPGITELAANGLDPGAHIVYLGNSNFEPEFSLQQDIGADFYHRDIAISASIFNNYLQHYIYLSQLTDAGGNTVTDAQGNKTFQYQQAAAQLYGMEWMVNIHPLALKGFSFDNSCSVAYGFNRNKIYRHAGINGEFLPLIPPFKWQSSVAAEIKTSSITFTDFNCRLTTDYSATQNKFLALNNTETATSDFFLVNVSFGCNLHFSTTNTVLLQLQVNNLFDKVYQSNLSRLKYFEYYTRSPSGSSGIYDMGRNTCLKAIWSL